jgi:hypothetical protein
MDSKVSDSLEAMANLLYLIGDHLRIRLRFPFTSACSIIGWCAMCREEKRLREAYDAALFAWKRHSQFLGSGVYTINARSRLRRQLLDARFKDANDLYDHCVKCPDCKIARLSSFDAVG